jgi:hypothetical protein
MALVLIALDPGTDGEHCPALILDSDTGDLVVQGEEVADPKLRADVNGLSPTGPRETVVRLPARMRDVIIRALMEEGDADAGVAELR